MYMGYPESGSHQADKVFGDQMQALRPMTLKPETEDALVQLTRKRSTELVRMHTTDKSACRVTFVKEKRGVSVFEGTNPKNQFMVKGETTVRASVEDILDRFRMGSTGDFDEMVHKLFDLYAYKGATLAFVTNQPISVHWMALNTDKMETRDIVFASYAQLYEQTATGSLVTTSDHSDGVVAAGSLVWESVNMAREIPLLRQKLTGCTRYFMRNCGFYVEQTNDTDVSRVSFVLTLENETGYVRGSKWMHRLAMCVANLARNLRTIELVPKPLWKETEHCILCRKTFRTFRRRHHCRLCGNSVCNDCSKSLPLDGRPVVDQGHVVHVSAVRSCTRCFDAASMSSGSAMMCQRSSSEYSESNSSRNMSFDDAKNIASMRSNGTTSITKSFDHSHRSDSSATLHGDTASASYLSHSLSPEQLHSMDKLMNATTLSALTPAVPTQPNPTVAEPAFFVLAHKPYSASEARDDDDLLNRLSYITLDDQSSSSVVYDVDGANGYDISATEIKRQPRVPPSLHDPDPESWMQFKVFGDAATAGCSKRTVSPTSSTTGVPKTLSMRGDMILLE
ncbi:hypothetical protein H310_13275 [Aphanomyces invadans]|uniref:FYVE-type domain-containing protein n=1 Tax=Aphanomyces invadans TaxID=157072 RepID=A0A024TE16_9STRA|nr:hypothetical protein H310_13275 [Aphanomyces invadans]ETV92380.1 hypothetical protein H310_13275 [Aphanomyces invadans]|eukprot:XP_008878931.1 hypothetical protein H310_13275 [Aphanomyces invadans]